MKLNKIIIKKSKLLKLYILKYQIYLTNSNDLNNKIVSTLENIEVYLKKSLKLIHEYHSKKKKILFVGFSLPKNNLLFQIKNNTKHMFISKKLWNPRLLSNKHNLPNLIVIFNSEYYTKIIKEADNFKIPVIFFGNLFNNIFMYIIPGNYKKIIYYNIYSLLLISILRIKQTPANNTIPKVLIRKNYNKKKLIFQQSKYKNTKQRYNDYKKI